MLRGMSEDCVSVTNVPNSMPEGSFVMYHAAGCQKDASCYEFTVGSVYQNIVSCYECVQLYVRYR